MKQPNHHGTHYMLFPNLDFFKQHVDNLSNDGVEYKLNSFGLRCDEFSNNHDGLHILFAGCSNTFGLGTDIENVWAKRLYNKIKQTDKVSGYYNIGINAGSIIEIIFHVYRYIEKYKKPDYIFLLFPERYRDDSFFNDQYFIDKYGYRFSDSFNLSLYHSLELFCNESNIKLISSSWVLNYNTLWRSFINNTINKIKNPNKVLEGPKIRNEEIVFKDFNKYFKTFKELDKQKMLEDLFIYSNENKNDENMYEAKDDGRHFGNAFHYAWSQQLYERFINEKNNKKN